ncbi:MAG: DedA family protein [Flavobacteriales bacterium]
MQVWDYFTQLMNPESIIHHGGLVLLLLVVFAENGLVIGFFLPGDSLIFLAGLVCATKPDLLGVGAPELIIAMFLAAILGSLAGYYFGWRVGNKLFERKDSLIFKRKYLEMTKTYYQKHGGKTLILGRFMPVIRTFAPIVAGVIRVPFPTFMVFNVIGGALWILSLGLGGYYLGAQFPQIEGYLGYIIVGFILITNILLIRTYLIQRRESKRIAAGGVEQNQTSTEGDDDTPILMP